MSENIPESIPTSVSKRSHRPVKKQRAAPSSASQQSQQVEALFANPDRADLGVRVGPKTRAPIAPPEIVANVQGSSAGAGSGEFHVYKASRRREYERLRLMDEEVRTDEAEKEYHQRKEEREKRDEDRLNKNRAKREKAKKRQEKKKLPGAAETEENACQAGGGDDATVNKVVAKKKLGAAQVVSSAEDGESKEAEGAEDDSAAAVGITIHDDD